MVTDILKDITYLGHLAQRKSGQCLYAGIPFQRTDEQDWIIVENTHEAIIEQELFDKVQAINNEAAAKSKANSGKYDHLPKAVNIYGKKFTCADCGSIMKLGSFLQHEERQGVFHIQVSYLCRAWYKSLQCKEDA